MLFIIIIYNNIVAHLHISQLIKIEWLNKMYVSLIKIVPSSFWNDGKNISQVEGTESTLSIITLILNVAYSYHLVVELRIHFKICGKCQHFIRQCYESIQRNSTAVLLV
jgi:hypothetical protein